MRLAAQQQQQRFGSCGGHKRINIQLPRGPRARTTTTAGGSDGIFGSSSTGGDDGSSTLAAHQFWLQRQRVLHQEPHPSDADIMELNCGGTIMVTSRCTLRQVKGSLLSLLFDPANSHLLSHDTAGRVFLDLDPAAFGLLLRHLREIRAATGYGSTPVVLPAIPPADAPSFRALNSHLGLGIPENDINAAVLRGASLAAAATAAPPYLVAGYERPSASPYASRPAPRGVMQQQQQQHWLQQQWRQQQSPSRDANRPQDLGPQQQQQPWQLDGRSPTTPNSATSAHRHHLEGVSSPTAAAASASAAAAEMSDEQAEALQQQAMAAEWDALTAPRPRQQQHRGVNPAAAAATAAAFSNTVPGAVTPHQQHQQLHHQQHQQQPVPAPLHQAKGNPPSQRVGGAASGDDNSAALQMSTDMAQEHHHAAPPHLQDFYMLTNPAGHNDTTATTSMGALQGAPLRVTVLTESDMLALQHAQQQQQNNRGFGGFGSSSRSSSDSSWGFGEPGAGQSSPPLDFDIFCSSSSSQGLMSLSLVVRESAGVDNVFVGVTTPNQADQRGLQIPSFGWHQVVGCPPAAAAAAALPGPFEAQQQQHQHHQQQQQQWSTGDLVQVVLQRGSSNSLSLNVTNAGSLQSLGPTDSSSMRLPAFRQWCWYLAFYRGTHVVAVVLDTKSYSVYSGDTQLKRYMS